MTKYNLIYIPGEAFQDGRIPTEKDHKVVGTYNTVDAAMEAAHKRDWAGEPGMMFVKKVELA